MDVTKYRFYVGTARGVLLSTGEKPNEIKIYKNDETTEVTALCEGRSPDEIILGYQSGNAQIFDTQKAAFVRKLDNLEGDESVIGCCCIKNSFIIGKRDGIINISKKKKNDFFSLNLDESGSLDAMVANTNRPNLIGTGGEFNDYKLWDIDTRECIFKAKSLGHDHLQLPIPTSIRDITFFNQEPNLGACCTKEGHVLLYDDRAQRRPTVKFQEEKASYTTISTVFGAQQVCVGTTKGYMQWLDLRQPAKVLKTYTSFTGSVSSIVCNEPFVASVSLDRYLRVHNMQTKELVSKLYMKQNLTKLLVKQLIKDEQIEEVAAEKEREVDQEYEDLFDNMEEVQEGGKKEKSKRKKDEEKTTKKVKKSKKI
ncbi:unnamed protein product [Ceutorhynchus assimilis]|uniref:WD repeat-containing protein 74 n=1 Tax=Ceutorhynchus assimilis TaxID=467358 RepID=A0A9N9MGW6_9CUCU|nr:unnamed protein product [Ceutorhynchus assimilis]